MDINELKEYLRIDGEDEDKTLSSFLSAAKAYIKTGTGMTEEIIKDKDVLELYKVCVKLIVSEMYENRIVNVIGASVSKLTFSLETILTQLEVEYLKIKDDKNESRTIE